MTSTQNTQKTKRNFKIGDLVKCTSESYAYIFKGECYVVLDTTSGSGGTQNIDVETSNGLLIQRYPSEDFELVQSKKQKEPVENTEFDMLNTPWFIRVKDEEEFKIAKEFVKSKGLSFQYGEEYREVDFITNYNNGKIQKLLRTNYLDGDEQEIKLHFKTEKVLDSVQYPEVQSEDPDQLEIQKIEDEMRKLADRLNAIKKN